MKQELVLLYFGGPEKKPSIADGVKQQVVTFCSFLRNRRQDMIRLIKSRRLRWAGHVARMGERCIQDFSGET
jgi:hypothetical protein